MGLAFLDPLPKFELIGTDEKTYNISSFNAKKVLCVIFTCNHCPYAQGYEQRILRLQDEYGIQGLQIVLINSNDPENVPEDSFEGMKQRAREHHYIVPYLWDKTQGVAKRFGAVCTPEAFLFDRKRQLKYRGRIDDNWRDPNRVKERSLALAVSDVLAGKEPVPHERPAMGCSIKWK